VIPDAEFPFLNLGGKLWFVLPSNFSVQFWTRSLRQSRHLKRKRVPTVHATPPPPLPRGAGKYGKRIDVGIEIVGNQ